LEDGEEVVVEDASGREAMICIGLRDLEWRSLVWLFALLLSKAFIGREIGGVSCIQSS
jgi:hypothetical protein